MGGRRFGNSITALEDRYQALLALVADADEPVRVRELAERLVKQGEAVLATDEYEDAVEQAMIRLHHNDLPRLDETGLLAYDRDSNLITAEYERNVEPERMETGSIAELLSSLPRDTQADTDTIGVLTGRQAVIECGRALADEAADELFCMYVSTDLLEDRCLSHAKDAIARGVDVYMGTCNEEVRSLTRRHLPEATVWEPQRDWLNSAAEYPQVGRLVLVDRKKVMLAILKEPGPDGTHPQETAMVGEGEDNPLVVLVRDLLGSRLDHLDFQSADFQRLLHT